MVARKTWLPGAYHSATLTQAKRGRDTQARRSLPSFIQHWPCAQESMRSPFTRITGLRFSSKPHNLSISFGNCVYGTLY